MHTIEEEVASIKATQEATHETILRVEKAIENSLHRIEQSMRRHEDQDDTRFDNLWKAVGRTNTKLAYYTGGIAALVALAEFLFKR